MALILGEAPLNPRANGEMTIQIIFETFKFTKYYMAMPWHLFWHLMQLAAQLSFTITWGQISLITFQFMVVTSNIMLSSNTTWPRPTFTWNFATSWGKWKTMTSLGRRGALPLRDDLRGWTLLHCTGLWSGEGEASWASHYHLCQQEHGKHGQGALYSTWDPLQAHFHWYGRHSKDHPDDFQLHHNVQDEYLYGYNIVLAGHGSKYARMAERISMKLSNLPPPSMVIRVNLPSNNEFCGFVGGTCWELCCMMVCGLLWRNMAPQAPQFFNSSAFKYCSSFYQFL